jgi:hypothetical protein
MCPPQQRGELGDVRRESMPSSLCALANKFEHPVPEQKKFVIPSGSAARRECPGSSRRLNRAVATIRSMVPHSNKALQSVAPERVFATLQPQQFSARLPSGERQLGDVGGDAPGDWFLVSRSQPVTRLADAAAREAG